MLVWLGETIRATRDADLLGFGELTDATLEEIVKEICAVGVEPHAAPVWTVAGGGIEA